MCFKPPYIVGTHTFLCVGRVSGRGRSPRGYSSRPKATMSCIDFAGSATDPFSRNDSQPVVPAVSMRLKRGGCVVRMPSFQYELRSRKHIKPVTQAKSPGSGHPSVNSLVMTLRVYSIFTSTSLPTSRFRRNSFASLAQGSPALSRAAGRGARMLRQQVHTHTLAGMRNHSGGIEFTIRNAECVGIDETKLSSGAQMQVQ